MARSTMNALIQRLRQMTEAGISDYTIGPETYWDTNHLQTILDQYRVDVWEEQLAQIVETGTGNTAQYKEYASKYRDFEQTNGGTAVFIVKDSLGNVAGTALYTPDYVRGRVTFASSTGGTVYYLTGRSYDLNEAAAEVWRQKASHYASAYDFSTDNHRMNRSQLMKHAMEMAGMYSSFGGPSVITMERDDAAL